MLQDVAVGEQVGNLFLCISPLEFANEGLLFSGASSSMIAHDKKCPPKNKRTNMRLETRVVFERPRIFLVADKDIKKDDVLYWDYKVRDSEENKNYNYFPQLKDVTGKVVSIDSTKNLTDICGDLPPEMQD